jgi:hypothetical protein
MGKKSEHLKKVQRLERKYVSYESTGNGGGHGYTMYLESTEWHILRLQRLAMDNNECVLCGREARQVHHRRYPKTLGTETVNDLVSLCSGCHTNYHEFENSKRA